MTHTPRKSRADATLKSWVLFLRVGEILKVKTVRSIKAIREKTGISSSCMNVIQVIDV